MFANHRTHLTGMYTRPTLVTPLPRDWSARRFVLFFYGHMCSRALAALLSALGEVTSVKNTLDTGRDHVSGMLFVSTVGLSPAARRARSGGVFIQVVISACTN